jgi:hypothetical protein
MTFQSPRTCSEANHTFQDYIAYRGARPNEPPHQNINPTSTRDISINMSSIEAALAAIKSLQPGEQFSYRQIAAQYHCNRTTLARRHKAISVLRKSEA